MADVKIDPITLEIISHKIWQITDEMGIVLERASGSPVVYEVKDYMTALYDADGNALMVGCGVVFHGAATVGAVKYIADTYREDPGIHEGDVFIANDPYIAAAHQPDMAIITPIHHKGDLIAWAASTCHVADTGGIDPGGFCTRATEVYQEGFRSPGIKISEKGKIRKDVWDTILNMVRDPGGVGLDLKAEIASGETAKRAMLELVDQYGAKVFKGLCQEIINYSEVKLRARLKEPPDGTWRCTQYLDDDGAGTMRKIMLAMSKEGDSLVFDFTGTDGQAPSNRNSSMAVTRGGVFGALAPMLCYDIPWNQGVLNVMKTIIPEGSIINPTKPAALTEGPIGPAYLAHDAAAITLSEMLNASEEWKDEAAAMWTPSVSTQAFAAVNQYGHFIATIFADIQAGGGGARAWSDGVDTGGILWQPLTTLPNVEAFELILPILYLFRRQTKDGGGPGKFRGGVGGEYAIMLHDSPTGVAVLPPYGCIGTEAAIGYGIAGGYPTLTKQYKIVRQSDIQARLDRGDIPQNMEEIQDELQGDFEFLATNEVWTMKDNDVFFQNWFGGGGYGDPIDRDPEKVLRDVENDLVSHAYAVQIYGVVINPETNKIDIERTNERREQIKKIRLQTGKKSK